MISFIFFVLFRPPFRSPVFHFLSPPSSPTHSHVCPASFVHLPHHRSPTLFTADLVHHFDKINSIINWPRPYLIRFHPHTHTHTISNRWSSYFWFASFVRKHNRSIDRFEVWPSFSSFFDLFFSPGVQSCAARNLFLDKRRCNPSKCIEQKSSISFAVDLDLTATSLPKKVQIVRNHGGGVGGR